MNTHTAPTKPRKNFARQLALRALRCAVPQRCLLVQGERRTGSIYLTFDDGPDPDTTPRILDTLRAHGAKATFFVVGRQVAAHPEIVRRMLDEGHAVGGHTYHHLPPQKVNGRQLLEEVQATDAELVRLGSRDRTATAPGTKLFRPPYGKLTIGKFWRLWSARRTVVLWNKDPKDFAATSTEQLLDWFHREQVQAGDIVLLHDTSRVTADALDAVLTLLTRPGLQFAPLA